MGDMDKNKKRIKFVSLVVALITLAGSQIWSYASDKFGDWRNKMIDDFIQSHNGDVIAWIFKSPLTLISALSVVVILIILIDWYFRQRKAESNKIEISEVKPLSDNIAKGETKDEKIEFDKEKSSLELCQLAQGFNDKFHFIRYAMASESERQQMDTGKDVFLLRRQNSEDSFRKLSAYFEKTKWYLYDDDRKSIEDDIQKLWRIFLVYSNNVQMYVDQKNTMGAGIIHADLIEQVFGEPADKALNQSDDTVEDMIKLLTPYVRGEK
jgi:hypothetical protein